MTDPLLLFAVALAAFAAGAAIAWLAGRARLVAVEARREAEAQGAAEKLALVEDARERLADTFRALSAQALESNNASFLELARTQLERLHEVSRGEMAARQQAIGELVAPVREALGKVEAKIGEAERLRAESHGSLTQHLEGLAVAHTRLTRETGTLAQALRSPTVRGRWGEIQLHRVVEMAGMAEHCDFVRQETLRVDGGVRRPDLVVRLPGGRSIAVDSKAPLQRYLEAVEAGDEEARRPLLADYARQVRRHLHELASRSYWQGLDGAPELVVLFLPGETFFHAALEQQPELVEHALDNRVLLASPTTLVALLKAVAYGWREERMAESAREVAALGRQLHDRLRVLFEHFAKIGGSLERAVDAYNAAVGSLESRVLPGARRFRELGAAGGDELPPLALVDRRTRQAAAPGDGLPGADEEPTVT